MPSSRSSALKMVGLTSTLRSCELFSDLSSGDIETIAEFTILKNLAREKYLFRQGDPAEGVYVIQRGAINVHRVNHSGKEQVIHVFRTGESLSEGALSSPNGYPADARAVEASTVLLIPKSPFLDFIKRRPDLALRIVGSVSAHLRSLIVMLDDLTLKDVKTRLLDWLVKRAQAATNGVIALSGTKRVLAAELGTSSETLSRTLGRLRDQKMISVGARSITVLDASALLAHLRRNLGEA